MLKKLGRFVLILIVTGAVLLALNAENLCKKYVYPIRYDEYVEEYSSKNNIDKYLIYAIIKTESGFDSNAVSDVGARGLMQLMEDAYDWVGYRMEDGREISYDHMFVPEYNIEYGTYLLMLLYDEYGDFETTLAAYHSGRGNVNKWLENSEYSSDGKTLDNIPSAATKHYVEKVMSAYSAYNNLYK